MTQNNQMAANRKMKLIIVLLEKKGAVEHSVNLMAARYVTYPRC
jgi:hypothetical protein